MLEDSDQSGKAGCTQLRLRRKQHMQVAPPCVRVRTPRYAAQKTLPERSTRHPPRILEAGEEGGEDVQSPEAHRDHAEHVDEGR